MAIAFRDAVANWGSVSPFTLAIPGDVQAGDIVVVYASVFSATASISLTGSVNTPTRLVPMASNGVNDSCTAWAFVAAAGDAGATLTFTEVGASTFIGAVIQAYSGAGMPLATTAWAVSGFNNASTSTWTAPSLAAGAPVAGCWGIYCISAGIGSGDGGATYPSGSLRAQSTASGINGWDSNGPLGAAGSAVGGGQWTTQSTGPMVGIVIALPPAGATVAGVTATMTGAAPAGLVSAGATVAGAAGTSALAAPAGSVSAGATVSGLVATESLAAPAGAVRIAPQQGTATIVNAPSATATIVNTPMGIVIAGTLMTSTVTFASEQTGQAADPTTVTLKYLPPGGSVQTVVYPATGITRVSAGVYSAELDTTGLPGDWTVEWIGTGAVQAIEDGSFPIAQAAL